MKTVTFVILIGITFWVGCAPGLAQTQTTVTIATVNNGDMIRMRELSGVFTKDNPDIALYWVTLDENTLRQRVTTDIATKGGRFDVLTIGNYEVPIWAKRDWLVPLDNMPEGYDVDDIIPAIRAGLSVDGTLYATLVIATWCYYSDKGLNRHVVGLDIVDAMKDQLHQAAMGTQEDVLSFLKLEPIFGYLIDNERFITLYAEQVKAIYEDPNVARLMAQILASK